MRGMKMGLGLLKPLSLMERQHTYRVYYGNILIKVISATTEWEAIERVYSNIRHIYPTMDRNNFKAKKK